MPQTLSTDFHSFLHHYRPFSRIGRGSLFVAVTALGLKRFPFCPLPRLPSLGLAFAPYISLAFLSLGSVAAGPHAPSEDRSSLELGPERQRVSRPLQIPAALHQAPTHTFQSPYRSLILSRKPSPRSTISPRAPSQPPPRLATGFPMKRQLSYACTWPGYLGSVQGRRIAHLFTPRPGTTDIFTPSPGTPQPPSPLLSRPCVSKRSLRP
jgi:hypothetical protein